MNLIARQIYTQHLHIETDRVAVVYNGESLSYCEFEEQTNLLSSEIQRRFAENIMHPVLIYMERSISYIVTMVSLWKAGVAYIPLTREYPEERLKYIIEDSCARGVLCDKREHQTVFDKLGVSILNVNEITRCGSNIEPYNVKSANSDVAYIIYTSGSSGQPKGVKISYANMYNLYCGLHEKIYSKHNRFLNIAVLAEFSFDASIKQILMSFLCSNTLVIIDNKDKMFPRRLFNFFSKNKIDVCDMTPSLLQVLIKEGNVLKETYLPNILLLGGEVLNRKVINEFKQCFGTKQYIYNVYGPTECCVDVSCYEVNWNSIDAGDIVPVGKPLNNNELAIYIESGNFFTQKENVKGELCISGKSVGIGYTGNKEFPLLYKDKKVWYRTGDVAYRDINSNYIVVGRFDDQVKINGFRIELADISNVLLKHNNVQSAVTIVYLNKLYLCYILQNKEKKDTEIGGFLSKQIPRYMFPNFVVELNELYVNCNGKCDKAKIIEDIKEGKIIPQLLREAYI